MYVMPEKKPKNRKMGETINTSAGTTIKRSGKREVQNFCALLSSFCFLVVSCYRYRRQATIGHKALKTLTDCHQRIWTNRIWRFQFFFSLNQVNCIFVDFLSDGKTPIVTEEEVEETDPTGGKRGQFYHNPTFLGVLIGVGALIVVVIVCLLLVAFRGGHISLDKLHGKCCRSTLYFSWLIVKH